MNDPYCVSHYWGSVTTSKKFPKKFFTCFNSRLSSRARRDVGDAGGVPQVMSGESARTGDRPRQIGLEPRDPGAMLIGTDDLTASIIMLK